MPLKQCNGELKFKPSLTSRHFSLADNIWGKTLRHLNQYLPQVFAYYCLPTNWFFLQLQTLLKMSSYAYFAKDPGWWEEFTQVLWGYQDICPSLTQFQVAQVTQSELSVLSLAGAWGDVEKFWGNMAFLLIAPKKTIEGEMAFGLAEVWVHPYQACLSSLDEAVKKPTLLINLGNKWAYTFVQLNKDAQHIPLPIEGHLSAMIDGMPSRNMCRCLWQLEVCKLVQYGDLVVYPEVLNGDLKPVQTFLSGLLLLGGSTHEPLFLLVDLSWVTPEDHMLQAPAPTEPWHHLPLPILPWNICMTAEVQDLLSHAILNTSSQESDYTTPKGQASAALEARTEDSSKPVATFPQVSLWVALPDNIELIGHSSPTTPTPEAPGVAGIPAALPSKTSTGDDMGALPKEVLCLQGEMNRIMGWLLTTRVSMDACQRKEVSDFQMALHQNKAWTTKFMREAEAVCTTAIREVKAHCANIIQDAEATCARTIREVETASTEHTCFAASSQGQYGGSGKGGGARLPIFPNCLWGCPKDLPPGAHGVQMYPLQLLTGNMPLATLLAFPPQEFIAREEPTPVISHLATPVAPAPSSGMKQWCHLPNQVACSPSQGDEVVETSKEPPCQKWKDGTPFRKLLKGGQWEAFVRDSSLVQQAREDYFWTNQPEFDCKFLCDLAGLFWEMITSISLLDSEIYEILEVWTRQENPQYANDALKLLPKGLQFSAPCPLQNHPKSWA